MSSLPELDLPTWTTRMLPPLVPIDYMIDTNRNHRANYPKGLLSPAERWERKVHEPFILD